MEGKEVDVKQLKTPEQYATTLGLAILSLQTFFSYQQQAYKEGLLSDDQHEESKAICWEIIRLIKMYGDHMNNFIENTELTQESIINCLHQLKSFGNEKEQAGSE